VALIGPHANATAALVGNYLGILCPSGGDSDFSCVESVGNAMKKQFPSLTYEPGCELTKPISGGVDAAVAAAKDADVVVLVSGRMFSLYFLAHSSKSDAIRTCA
jgi:hypothetical protein